MAAIGTLATNSGPIFAVNGFYQRGGALPSRIVTPITVAPVNTGQSRVAPAPTPAPAVLMPKILTTTVNNVPIGPPPPSGPTPDPYVAPTTTGPTTGASSGSTGTSDTSRLLDMIAGAFQPQAVAPSLAPTSVSSTSTTDPTASSGPNPLAFVVLAVVVIAGIMWYTKRNKKKAA